MCLSLCVKADDELRWFPRSYPCILGPHVIGEKGITIRTATVFL